MSPDDHKLTQKTVFTKNAGTKFEYFFQHRRLESCKGNQGHLLGRQENRSYHQLKVSERLNKFYYCKIPNDFLILGN